MECYALGCTISNIERAGVLFKFPKDAKRYSRSYVPQFLITEILTYTYVYTGVPGGKDLTSGECSLGQTIQI
jgi:hypothetical protein